MTSQIENNPNQTLLAIVNHIVTQHPELAKQIEQIVQNIHGGRDGAAARQQDNLLNEIIIWGKCGYAAPSPHFIKQSILLRNALPNSIWVETGTYLGHTTKELCKHGSFVYSIEPEPTLYSNAVEYFKSYQNVEILKGLSEEIFPSLLPKLSGNINFWLDGHYSAGITHKGPKDTPILDELEHISENLNHLQKVCVMVDDIRCFNPDLVEYSAYPSLNVLVDWANKNGLSWHIEHDIFVARTKA
jgi:hypothetical protein